MNFDLRLPIGIMFSIIGALLVVFGLTTGGGNMYVTHSLGININLWWGLVLFVFGALMLLSALRGRKKRH